MLVVGEVELEGLPEVSVGEGDVEAELSAGEEEAGVGGVFADGVDEGGGGDAVGDELPGVAEVGGAVDERGAVVDAMALNGSVGDGGVEVRGLDEGDARPGCETGGGDVGPGFAAVAGEGEDAGVRAGPDEVGLDVGGGDGGEGAVATGDGVAGVGGFSGDRAGDGVAVGGGDGVRNAAGVGGGFGCGAGEVRGDFGPVEAAVGGLEDVLGAHVERSLVYGRKDERGRPGVAVAAGGDL